MNFVTLPTPENGTIKHTDSVSISVEITGPEAEAPELVRFSDDNNTFDSGEREFYQTEIPVDSNFINLSDGYTTGTFQSRIYNATVNTVWDNLSWGGVLPVTGEITPDENTVLLFHLNNDSVYEENDIFIYDFSSNGNNGTAEGARPNLTDYKLGGGAFEFDGDDDYVNCGHDASLNISDEVTVEAWVYMLSSDNTESDAVVTKHYDGSCVPFHLGSFANGWGGGTGGWSFGNYNGVSWATAGISSYNTNEWVHLAGVYNNTDLILYVDGIEKATAPRSGGLCTNDLDVSVGKIIISEWTGGTTSNNAFNGIIDEVAIYNRALTSDEISSHANAAVIAGEIKFQARSCDDDSCVDDGDFVGPGGSTSQYYTDSGYNDVSSDVDFNKFFQYKAFFSTDTPGVSPELYNVTVEGHSVVEAEELNINSSWVDWNGQNISLNGSGLSWNGTMSSLSEGDYIYRVYANDSYDNSNVTEERTVTVDYYGITFNVTSGEDGSPIDYLDSISCNYEGFTWDYDTSNPYGPYKFPSGSWSCTFTETIPEGYWDETINFVADDSKTVNVVMSIVGGLMWEEHMQLDWLYNCWHDGDCWNLLTYINQTTSNIWDHFKRTDNSVILKEEILSNELNSTDNIKYNYTIYVPRKAGYADGDLLPIRMFFWFIDPADNLTCYDQNYKENETAETPICNPLMAQTLGPMNDNTNFVVDLKPGLPVGTYNVVRAVEIDPHGEWINYGQEIIGQITVSESNEEAGINIKEIKTEVVKQQTEQKISEQNVKENDEKESESSLSKITGGVISDVLSSSKVNLVIGLLFLIVCLLIFQNVTFWKTRKK